MPTFFNVKVMIMGSMVKKLVMVAGVFLAFSIHADVLKVGVVDLHKVVSEASQVKAIKKALETKFKPRQQKLVALQEAVKLDMTTFQRDSSVMADAKKKALQEKIVKARQELAQKGQAYEQELGDAQNKAMQQFFEKVKGIVEGIAKDGKFDLVLQNEGLPYAAPKLDITDKVLSKL
jgi:outer membrane protein